MRITLIRYAKSIICLTYKICLRFVKIINFLKNSIEAHHEFAQMSKRKAFDNKNVTDYLLWIFKEKDFTLKGFKKYFDQRHIEAIRQVNQFFEADFARLGSELHAATYAVKLGGKYKPQNTSRWIGLNKENTNLSDVLPLERTVNFNIDGLDLSKTVIQADGLDNIENCRDLKILLFKECPYVDDWLLARLPNLACDKLEVLDISGCDLVTDNGLIMLGHLKNLKKLKMSHLKNAKNKEFISVLLEETINGLEVEGCDYTQKIKE